MSKTDTITNEQIKATSNPESTALIVQAYDLDASDEQIIARAGHRIRIELQIVRKTIRTLTDAGYQVAVQDGKTADKDLVWDGSERRAIGRVFSVDESHLLVRKHGGDQHTAWVFFVRGNDGHDTVSNYSTSLTPEMTQVEAYAVNLENTGGWTLITA